MVRAKCGTDRRGQQGLPHRRTVLYQHPEAVCASGKYMTKLLIAGDDPSCPPVTAELCETQTEFHRLVDRADHEVSAAPPLTNRQLLYHMVFGYIFVRTRAN